jgi:hypothetical protein
VIGCSGAPGGHHEEAIQCPVAAERCSDQQIDQDAAVRRRRALEKSNKGASGGFEEGLR